MYARLDMLISTENDIGTGKVELVSADQLGLLHSSSHVYWCTCYPHVQIGMLGICM